MTHIKSLIVATLVLTSTGCEMAGQTRNISSGQTDAFSCEQIRAAFDAYDADRASFDALSELSGMTGYELTEKAKLNADAYYDKAKNSANLALIVKGCDPL